MKKLISILLILAFPLFARAGITILGGSPPAGDTYSDIVFWWRCESTTLGAGDHSHGDTTATLNDNAAINTDAVKLGTNGLDLPSPSDFAGFTLSSGDILPDMTAGRLGFWTYINTWVNGCRFLATLGGNYFYFYMSGTEELVFYWIDRTATTTTADLTTGVWYYLELAWDKSDDTQKIFVNGVEKATQPLAKGPVSNGTSIRYGNATGAYAADFFMDNIIVSNDPNRNLYLLKDLDSYPGP